MQTTFDNCGVYDLSYDEFLTIDGGGFFEGLGTAVGYVCGYVSEACANIAAGFHDAAHDINSK